jgi:glycolate oxidase FAD binding subunit
MVLARFGGVAARPQAESARRLLGEAGLEAELIADDESLWQAQRDAQRSPQGLVARVSGVQTDLGELAQVAERFGATLVGRAGLGLYWLRLDEGDAAGLLDELRHGYLAVAQDRPAGMSVEAPDANILQRRIKERFDPAGTLV